MAFNLPHVLKALLFSTSQPLAVKDLQAVFTRWHETANALPLTEPAESQSQAADESSLASAPEQPADAAQDKDVPELVTAAQIREAMETIAAELRAAQDVCELAETAQGWRLVTLPKYARWVRLLRHEPPPVRLSAPALETLAVVAYRQPVTRAEIESIRGVAAEGGLNKLLERGLIHITGRADLPGRPLQYATTEEFLTFVGARSLEELPASDVLSSRQIDEWLREAASPKQLGDAEMGLPQASLPLADDATPAPATALTPAESPPTPESAPPPPPSHGPADPIA